LKRVGEPFGGIVDDPQTVGLEGGEIDFRDGQNTDLIVALEQRNIELARTDVLLDERGLAEQAMDLIDAIRERRDRAIGVAREYRDEQVGPMSWIVSHPEDDERSYLVDLGLVTCTCPDFTARMNPAGLPLCKHVLSCADKHGFTVEIE
jgi:hypothetical protein